MGWQTATGETELRAHSFVQVLTIVVVATVFGLSGFLRFVCGNCSTTYRNPGRR